MITLNKSFEVACIVRVDDIDWIILDQIAATLINYRLEKPANYADSPNPWYRTWSTILFFLNYS